MLIKMGWTAEDTEQLRAKAAQLVSCLARATTRADKSR